MLAHKIIVAQSPSFLKSLELARKVAESCANVLLTGESGTGKEVMAHLIHERSPRSKKKFVALNCSAIPEDLLESELFGHIKGSFTGAIATKMGLFEEAEGGTLFLDEIADMDFNLQAKLLRVLQERQLRRVGENHYRNLDIRVIAATHENLHQAVREKKFREDLFFRLNVINIEIPPLRGRREDIIPLSEYFLKHFAALNGKSVEKFSPLALDFLLSETWPGNVRELENLIERAVVLASGPQIELQDLLSDKSEAMASSEDTSQVFDELVQREHRLLSIEELNDRYIKYALGVNHGAKDKTARDLGIDRKTLYRKLVSKATLSR